LQSVLKTNLYKIISWYSSKTASLTDTFSFVNISGTFTGMALKHVQQTIFKEDNGDRPDARNVVVLITDGRSQDDVKEASSSLRQRGATVSETMRQTNIFV